MSYIDTMPSAQAGPDVNTYLESGEQIVWQGQPGAGSTVNRQPRLAGLILLAVGGSLGVIFLLVGSPVGDSPVLSTTMLTPALIMFLSLVLPGLLLILVGSAGRPITNYYLTNRRAILISGPTPGNRYRTTLINLAALDTTRLIQNVDGSGTLVFGRSNSYYGGRNYNNYSYYDLDHSFVNIPNVVEVLHRVQNAQAGISKQQG